MICGDPIVNKAKAIFDQARRLGVHLFLSETKKGVNQGVSVRFRLVRTLWQRQWAKLRIEDDRLFRFPGITM